MVGKNCGVRVVRTRQKWQAIVGLSAQCRSSAGSVCRHPSHAIDVSSPEGKLGPSSSGSVCVAPTPDGCSALTRSAWLKAWSWIMPRLLMCPWGWSFEFISVILYSALTLQSCPGAVSGCVQSRLPLRVCRSHCRRSFKAFLDIRFAELLLSGKAFRVESGIHYQFGCQRKLLFKNLPGSHMLGGAVY